MLLVIIIIDERARNSTLSFFLSFFIHLSLTSLSLTNLAVAYSLEADADHRKKRLNSRAVFKDGSKNSYESKGTITLDTKGKKQCITRKLMIQVGTLS